MNSNNLKELLGELLIETYTRTVDDNKEDFSLTYYIIWKMANVLLMKELITEKEYKYILEIKNKEEREKEIAEWTEKN